MLDMYILNLVTDVSLTFPENSPKWSFLGQINIRKICLQDDRLKGAVFCISK